MAIPLHQQHKLDSNNPNSLNCLYWVPWDFGYVAVPAPGSDIKVLSFISNAKNTVLIESDTDYVISPEDPEGFVRELRDEVEKRGEISSDD